MKLTLDLLKKAETEFNPSPEEIQKIRARIASEPANTLDTPEQKERRKAMIASVAAEPVADALERYIGNNDLLPINYLLIGYLQSRSVGRIRYFDKVEGRPATATGFLVSEDLVMTNHHVFPVADSAEFRNFAEDAIIEFNHEYDIDGKARDPLVFELDPERFIHTVPNLDMALVGIRPFDRTGRHAIKNQGYLVLNKQLGKAGNGDFATIIQHPQGNEKQIALRKNDIINLDLPDFLIYSSDTVSGSSGAPVFNDQWQVIALHSAGVARKNAAGQYIDANGQVIEPVNGRIDADRVVWEHNRGVRVSAMMRHLASAASGVATHPLVQVLFSPAYTDSRPFAFLSRPAPETERIVPLVVSTPPTAVTPSFSPINIHISIGQNGQAVTDVRTFGVPPPQVAFEKKYEDELDFSDCDGFQEDFMNTLIPLPLPTPALRSKLAFLIESPSAYVLKYHHISTYLHAVRRVPALSAINVHAKFRHAVLDDEGSRQDKWFRDNRIDYDVQLNDAFYLKSGFDKGHLSRREDAEWGNTVAKAKLAADLTCSYANAIPQVPALNRNRFGYHGLWGQLEEKLLEQGIENESGKSARICVFSGPLFKNDDPVFKGVQVALSFFKVVVWYDGTGTLRATGFKLTQEDLVGEIAFEVLRFDTVFKTYQWPISRIEDATGITFHANIKNNDTSPADGDDPMDEGGFERMLKKYSNR